MTIGVKRLTSITRDSLVSRFNRSVIIITGTYTVLILSCTLLVLITSFVRAVCEDESRTKLSFLIGLCNACGSVPVHHCIASFRMTLIGGYTAVWSSVFGTLLRQTQRSLQRCVSAELSILICSNSSQVCVCVSPVCSRYMVCVVPLRTSV